ncbi:ANTAR domain-containing protein, partial [Streptomyces massasporeus]
MEQENAQLRHALASHATVDQAIGVLIAVHRIAPAAGFEVLREASQQTNIKLHSVAQTVTGWALGELGRFLRISDGGTGGWRADTRWGWGPYVFERGVRCL